MTMPWNHSRYPLFLIYLTATLIACGFTLLVVPYAWWRGGASWDALRGRGHQTTFLKIGACYAFNQMLGQVRAHLSAPHAHAVPVHHPWCGQFLCVLCPQIDKGGRATCDAGAAVR